MRALPAAMLAAALIVAQPARADDSSDRTLGQELDKAVKELDRAMESAIKSVERFFDDVPGYETPETLPNGDIIIRKKRPAPKSDPPASSDDRRDV